MVKGGKKEESRRNVIDMERKIESCNLCEREILIKWSWEAHTQLDSIRFREQGKFISLATGHVAHSTHQTSSSSSIIQAIGGVGFDMIEVVVLHLYTENPWKRKYCVKEWNEAEKLHKLFTRVKPERERDSVKMESDRAWTLNMSSLTFIQYCMMHVMDTVNFQVTKSERREEKSERSWISYKLLTSFWLGSYSHLHLSHRFDVNFVHLFEFKANDSGCISWM